ncbi:ComF family protein [Streptococcus ratti]|uniref:Late competence protein n=1 Tax=Streptococcus ratti FA-1 = DSM 20564 TaxID=699248 RepID=A0ABN0GX84_STRRT|nr:ComF family protein [Streptococcus ratti]EJN95181.1 putative late competence protein [Streptococcus ratti FA-1 = DSM 20564]EMP69883.1 late competence protein [Streptococcus ratti FA-1 = DSM 20564]QEY07171.1 ComF family protein [Streptococcus ratti]VEI59600.1 late competence protein [Streptococcus mutans]
MNCLLCQSPFERSLSFSSVFFLSAAQEAVCPSCFSKFQRISDSHCPACCKNGINTYCQDCLYWQSKGQKVNHRALFCYNQAMKDYFSTYKFQGDYLLRKVFAKTVKKALKNRNGYTLVPIPISRSSLSSRGFNQVEAFLDEAKLPYSQLLGKKDSMKQSSKKRQERLSSQQFFYLRKVKALPDKVILVDDIYTTGTTIQLASQLLCENGVKTVISFSLAR